MLNKFSRPTQWLGGCIALVVVITVVFIASQGNQTPTHTFAQYLNDNAAADNKVEALKTMTADLLAVQEKNKQLQHSVQQLQAHNAQAVQAMQAQMTAQLNSALAALKKAQKKQKEQQQPNTQATSNKLASYPVHHPSSAGFVWLANVAQPTDKSQQEKSPLTPSHSRVVTSTPAYTIPVNATLTGATLMTPLVGRIPIDGQLPSPYPFKLVLSNQNLTANGYPMPGIQGAVMSGVASGDLLGHCARGRIQSVTFIFKDGTISTTQVTGDRSLGYVSSEIGNPCIPGIFHSNAGLFLGAQMALAGAQGYANALTQSQYLNSTTAEGVGLHSLIGSANKAAVGQAGSAAAEAAQTWWNRRVQNSFDYVYVPNVNSNTGRAMKVVANITTQIDVNHTTTARKVSYENNVSIIHHQLD